jgi:alpha-L-arabinofuranosidase
LFVDAAQALGPISPYVYGSNYGPWLGISPESFPYVADAKLTFMRWPGGSWGDQNDVTPLQVDQFIALSRKLGWEPMITARLEDSTPQKAAELVQYANVTNGYGVRYWAIGNEPNLYLGDYDAALYNQEWREWATAMRGVDPSIKLLGPEVSQFYGHAQEEYQRAFTDWVVEFLQANGDLVDIVSVHRYPFPKSTAAGPPTIADLRDNSREWDQLIPALRALARENTGRDLPVAVTEVNSSWASNNGGEATMDSHYNAIWWADVLGRMIRQGVDIVAQWDVSKQWGIVGAFEPHPMYYSYLMYQHFGTERVYASSDDPHVSIFAAKRDDGALTLMIINLASEPAEKKLTLANITPAPAETWRFDQDHAAEQVAATPLSDSSTLTLPAESLTLLVLPAP